MKRLFLILAAASALMGLAACNEVENGPAAQMAGLNVRILTPGAVVTKGADLSVTGNEATLNSVTVFLFDGAGNLIVDGKQAATVSAGAATASWEKVPVGTYTVAAVANFGAPTNDPFSGIATIAALRAVATNLGDNNPASGFVMAGEGTVAVNPTADGGAANSAELRISRLVSRVRLVSVENKLPAAYNDFKVEQVFLINGRSAWNLGGTGEPTTYFNWAGRTEGNNNKAGAWGDATNYIIKSASDAQFAAMTHAAPDKTIAVGSTERFGLPFYTLQNAGTVDHFDGPTDGEVLTRLVVRASYGGNTYFYPVTIAKVERNKTYDVLFEISGPGSDDPNKSVSNGALNVNIIVDPWGDGGDPIVGSF